MLKKLTVTIEPDTAREVYIVTCEGDQYLAESEGDAVQRAKEMLEVAAMAAGVSKSELENWA